MLRLAQKRLSFLWSVRAPLDIVHNGEVGGESMYSRVVLKLEITEA